MSTKKGEQKKPLENWNNFYEEPGRERIYCWTARRFKKNRQAIFNHIRLYLINKETIYEDLNDISVLMEKYGLDVTGVKMDTHTPIIWYFSSRISTIFERLKVYREYRSPLTQRSFTKVLSFFLPILFAPWFVHMSESSDSTWKWLAVMYNALFTFILNGQTFITDRLFDPFIALSSDHIDLSKTLAWIDYAILKIEKRCYVPVDHTPPIPCGKVYYEDSTEDTDDIHQQNIKPFKVNVKSYPSRARTYILMQMEDQQEPHPV